MLVGSLGDYRSCDPFIFNMAEVLPDASSCSAPPSPSVPTAAGVKKLQVPGESASATASAGAGSAVEESSQKDNNPGSHGQGVEKSASREKSAEERERAVKAAEEAVRDAAGQLAAVRNGPSVRAEADKSPGGDTSEEAKVDVRHGRIAVRSCPYGRSKSDRRSHYLAEYALRCICTSVPHDTTHDTTM